MGQTVKQAVEEYLELGLSDKAANTKRSYKRALRVLLEVTGERMSVASLDRTHIDRALIRSSKDGVKALRESGVKLPPRQTGRSPEALNLDRSAYCGFVKYMQTRGYFHGKSSPTAHLRYVERKQKGGERKRPLTLPMALELLTLAGNRHPRDRMAVALALFTGMRVSEIADLKWGHVKWDDGEIHFPRDKGEDVHRAMFNPGLEEELLRWWAVYNERYPGISDDWYVIPSRLHGKYRSRLDRMNPEWPMVPSRPATNLHDCLKPLLAEVGVRNLEGKAWHTLRRTFANLWYKQTGDIRYVQEALGHAHQKTTEIYMDKHEQREKNKTEMRAWDLRVPTEDTNVVDFTARHKAKVTHKSEPTEVADSPGAGA